jgi:hypothetical protein
MLCALAIIVAASWASVSRADDPAAGNWLGRWFRLGKSANKNNLDDAPRLQPTPPPVGNRRAEALAAFHRRTEVCLKLQNIAFETGDLKLQLEVEQLEQEIWRHYSEMTKGDLP